MPVKILGLEIQREHIGQQLCQRSRYVPNRLRPEISRRLQRGKSQFSCFTRIHLNLLLTVGTPCLLRKLVASRVTEHTPI